MPVSESPPYLSIVATTRNDDHGKHMRQRMTLFVRGLLYQTRRIQQEVELILVEWNPIAGRPFLAEILPRPEKEDYLTIRYIRVPPGIHNTFGNADKIPLFQMIAKNVGIRRAKGTFVLCTNVDLLFSSPLFDFLAGMYLYEGSYYRCNRCDIPSEINYDCSLPDLLDYGRNNILNRLGLYHLEDMVVPKANAGERSNKFKLLLKSAINYLWPVFYQKRIVRVEQVDTVACGDFTLMSKQDWLKIGGYLELGAYSIHIDSLALYAAVSENIKQVVLPPSFCTYHVSHEDGWEQGDPFRKLIKDIERPMLQWDTVYRIGEILIKGEQKLQLNPPNWGLADHQLEEVIQYPE